jgi:flagellar basal-body rod protein FlgC
VANEFSTGALPAANGTGAAGAPQAYQPLRLNQTAGATGGTQTSVTAVSPSYVAISDPSAPFANPDGQVAAPNVDISQELVDQALASYSFTANARVLKAADQMTKTLLDTTARQQRDRPRGVLHGDRGVTVRIGAGPGTLQAAKAAGEATMAAVVFRRLATGA